MPICSSPSQSRARSVFGNLFSRQTLVFLALSFAVSVHAQRINFPATYKISQVSEADNQVKMTLSLTIHNFSGKDIQDCGIVLSGPELGAESLGSFDLVKSLPSFKDTTVSHKFVVPKSEYLRWKQGAGPHLDILLADGRGGTRIDTIDARLETHPGIASIPLAQQPAR